MRVTPGWWNEWCEAQSLNPSRPDRWAPQARAAFMAEKLRRFRLHWAWLSKLGQPAIIRQQSGRAELIRQVRRELEDAIAPCPESGPYESFRPPLSGRRDGGRPGIEPWDEVTMEEALAHVEAHPGTERLAVRTVKCLVWLTREFCGKVPA